MRLTDRVAIVTGAGAGLGAVYARAIAREGGRVTVVDMDGAGAEATAAALRAGGSAGVAVQADLTVEDQVARMVT